MNIENAILEIVDDNLGMKSKKISLKLSRSYNIVVSSHKISFILKDMRKRGLVKADSSRACVRWLGIKK